MKLFITNIISLIGFSFLIISCDKDDIELSFTEGRKAQYCEAISEGYAIESFIMSDGGATNKIHSETLGLEIFVSDENKRITFRNVPVCASLSNAIAMDEELKEALRKANNFDISLDFDFVEANNESVYFILKEGKYNIVVDNHQIELFFESNTRIPFPITKDMNVVENTFKFTENAIKFYTSKIIIDGKETELKFLYVIKRFSGVR